MMMNFMVYGIGMLGLLDLRVRASDGRRRRAWRNLGGYAAA